MECITGTGHYTFCFKDKKLGIGKSEMVLQYGSSSSPREVWSSEQIRDFVRKLGFIDKDKADGGEQIEQFLRLNFVSLILDDTAKHLIFFSNIDCVQIIGTLYEVK